MNYKYIYIYIYTYTYIYNIYIYYIYIYIIYMLYTKTLPFWYLTIRDTRSAQISQKQCSHCLLVPVMCNRTSCAQVVITKRVHCSPSLFPSLSVSLSLSLSLSLCLALSLSLSLSLSQSSIV